MRVTLKPCFRVDIIESESGWGQTLDETIYFDNEPEALKFVIDYNAKNIETTVPNWYMYARYVGKI